jgi:hypothetical protein
MKNLKLFPVDLTIHQVRAISTPDEDGAIDYVCNTTDAMSTWPDADQCGAGSMMTIVDETVTPHRIIGIGWFDGLAWALPQGVNL